MTHKELQQKHPDIEKISNRIIKTAKLRKHFATIWAFDWPEEDVMDLLMSLRKGSRLPRMAK